MPREVTIRIDRDPYPSVIDYVFGGPWCYTVSARQPDFYRLGFRWTEKQARRRAEKVVARLAKGQVSYSYDPAGFTPGDTGHNP